MLDVQETTPLIKQQLSFLWTSPLVQQLTACLPVAERQEYNNPDPRKETPDDKNLVTAFKKALGNSKSSKGNQVVYPTRKLGSPEVTQVALVASMYQTALSTLTQMRMDILTGKLKKPFSNDSKMTFIISPLQHSAVEKTFCQIYGILSVH
jgi:ubiquitin-protein ligase E3 B